MVGIGYALASSLCLAVMILFDRIMMGDCYRNHPDQPWVISSALGAILGGVTTGLVWMAVNVTDANATPGISGPTPLHYLLSLLSGIVSSLVIRYYFRLFTPSKDGTVDPTEIAVWLAFTPVFVFLALQVLAFVLPFTHLLPEAKGVDNNWLFGGLVVIACLALMLFVRFDTDDPVRRSTRYGDIFLLVVFNTGYVLLSALALSAPHLGMADTLALQMAYWAGFAIGGLGLLSAEVRSAFRYNAKRLRKFSGIIVLTEVIGMLVYFFEFLGVSEENPTLVTLIVGAHVTIVFILSLALAHLRRNMEANNQRRVWILGWRVMASKLPVKTVTPGQLLRLAAVQISLLVVLGYAYARGTP